MASTELILSKESIGIQFNGVLVKCSYVFTLKGAISIVKSSQVIPVTVEADLHGSWQDGSTNSKIGRRYCVYGGQARDNQPLADSPRLKLLEKYSILSLISKGEPHTVLVLFANHLSTVHIQ